MQTDLGALVLSRKAGECITIAGGITVEVLRCKTNGVKLRITAPRATKIVRGELLRLAEEAA